MKPSVLAVLFCALTFQVGAQASETPRFQAGAATSNITPPLGLEVIGGFVPFPSTYVHDELHVRCVVLDDGHGRLALVVCDLLGINGDLSNEARRQIEERVGLPPDRVLITATHTHSASSAMGSNRLALEQPLDSYQGFVCRRVVDAVACAVENLRPAEIAFATAEAPEHVFNRRWYLKEGTMPANPFGGIDQVKMNPPRGSESLVKPAGPTDPTVSILALREPGGKPIAVLSSYSLHYVGGVGAGHISADYYGAYCRELARLLEAERQDPPFVAIMANGTSGDINNINFVHPRPRQEPYAQIHAVANDVAAKVQAALGKLEYRDWVPLDARYREPKIGWRKVSDEQKQWAEATLAEPKPTSGKANLPRIYAARVLQLAKYPEASAIPLQTMRIGDVCIGTVPCEVLCEIGLEFKKRCPLKPAVMISLSHGYLGYLPPPNQHDLGGYETWPGTNRLERDASVKILDNLLEMAAEMKAAPAAK